MRASFAFAVLAGVALVAAAPLQGQAAKQLIPPSLRTDLADKVAGSYAGAVVADTSGAPRSGVTLTVTKVGANTVQVASSYARVPTFRVGLIQSGTTISQASGANIFRVDTSKTPFHLDVIASGATYAGDKL